MTRLLADKVVLITGAASGIGRATAALAADSGAAAVVVADVNDAGLQEVAELLAGKGTEVAPCAQNVTDAEAADRMVATAVERFGRLDAAVNAAGVMGAVRGLAEYTDDDFDSVMQVNVWGSFRCMRAELGQMYRQGSGSIVNLSSASVFGMHTELGPYIASKAAVLAMSRVAGKEAGPRGVRVNAVCPGLTDTAMSRQSMVDRPETEDILARIPIGRMAHPSEIAEAIVWLCSDRSSFTNASTLVVDGGRSG